MLRSSRVMCLRSWRGFPLFRLLQNILAVRRAHRFRAVLSLYRKYPMGVNTRESGGLQCVIHGMLRSSGSILLFSTV